MPAWMRTAIVLLAAAVLLSACATSRHRGPSANYRVKDNRPDLWVENHPRVTQFRNHYSRTTTVQTALQRARRYLPYIMPEIRRRRLPPELAYLPMLESMFDPYADSGHAKGLWQFTPQTARHMGLRVTRHRDDRLDVHKATRAAVAYLADLGEQFNYNWALALAAYNGGPGYVSRAMRRQHTWDFWELRLRQEVAEYVPRFIAMVQVAKARYPRMMAAGIPTPGGIAGADSPHGETPAASLAAHAAQAARAITIAGRRES